MADLTDPPQVSLTGRLARSTSVSRLNKLLDAISAELNHSLDAQTEDSDSKRSSVSDWEAHIDTTFSSLRFETEIAGTLLKLSTNQSGKPSWIHRFFVLTSDATLFMFRSTNNNTNAPITHLCVKSCNAYSSQNSWILELTGDGPADDDGHVGSVQWALKCPNEITLKHWLHTTSRVLTGSETFAATQRIMHRESMVLPPGFRSSIIRGGGEKADESAESPLIQRSADAVLEKQQVIKNAGEPVAEVAAEIVPVVSTLKRSQSLLTKRELENENVQTKSFTRNSLGLNRTDVSNVISSNLPSNPVEIGRLRKNSLDTEKHKWFSWFKK
ncbi:hypothetical protein HK100_003903 [Physocladia obscura]|uniref:PH domain-containing protein n=1 Tax=Physocladia obscura TaxID=109957 RepID=A0AAD5STK7_9FUNG|nr:hypothetical protein HK100_003903 [Physocladia obscura]